ncbi:MAG: MFS transporter [Deltaproteobacteria bacterium]|nr:MAG: MFS transporter [Deltaproteobacteria bacterium]
MNIEAQQTQQFNSGKVLLISICHFIHDIYSSFLAPLLPFIIEKFSLSMGQAGFLSTMMQLPSLLNPYIGKLADKMSVRWFIILAPMTTAIPMSLLGLAPSYGVLLILMFLTGVSVALFHVPAPVLIYKVAGSKVGRGMSFYMTGGELARALGPLAIISAVSLLGFDGYYPVMLAGLLASGLMYYKFKDIPLNIQAKTPPSLRKTCMEMKGILLPLSGILVTRGFMHACLTAFLPLFIIQQGGRVWLAGAGLALFEAAGVCGVMTVGSLSDRFGRKKVLLFSLVVAPPSLLAFSFASGTLQLVLLLITGFSLLSTSPVMLAMIQEHSKDGSSAANGIYMMISFLARSAVVVAVGFCADLLGLQQTYILCGLLGFAGIPMILCIKTTAGQQ